jgi:hypothetical protein
VNKYILNVFLNVSIIINMKESGLQIVIQFLKSENQNLMRYHLLKTKFDERLTSNKRVKYIV